MKMEVGGISITLLAYCAAKGFDADECETAELKRILSKTPEHFRQRQNDKAALGVAAKAHEQAFTITPRLLNESSLRPDGQESPDHKSLNLS